MTLTDFLLARIAEDEIRSIATGGATGGTVTAAGGAGGPHGYSGGHHGGVSSFAYAGMPSPGRLRREVAAKRRIIEVHDRSGDWCLEDETEWPCRTLRALASVYADHPDYHPEWTPEAAI